MCDMVGVILIEVWLFCIVISLDSDIVEFSS